MAKPSSSKKKARVWYSQGSPDGSRVAKGQSYRENSVMRPTGKKERRGF